MPVKYDQETRAKAIWLVREHAATSNAATAGTAPTSMASKERKSGAGTASSPTTWSRSQP
jgi:hypothetical protein